MNGQFDLGAITPTRYFFSIAVVLGLLFALTGNSEDDGSLFIRLLRWQLQTVGPMAFLIGAHLWLNQIQWFRRLNPWLKLCLSGLLGLLCFSPINLTVDIWLDAEEFTGNVWYVFWLEELSYLLPPALISWLAINSPWVFGYRLQRTAKTLEVNSPANADLAVSDSQPNLLELLATKVPGDLIYLKAELHYMLAVTTEGKTLLLYSLKDAISELENIKGYSGFHSHRSYWVSSSFVVQVNKQGRQGTLRLSNGEEIPISRNRLAEAIKLFTKPS